MSMASSTLVSTDPGRLLDSKLNEDEARVLSLVSRNMYSVMGHTRSMTCIILDVKVFNNGSNEVRAFSREIVHAACKKLTPSCESPMPAALAISSSAMVGDRRHLVARLNSRMVRWYCEPPYRRFSRLPTSVSTNRCQVRSETDIAHPGAPLCCKQRNGVRMRFSRS